MRKTVKKINHNYIVNGAAFTLYNGLFMFSLVPISSCFLYHLDFEISISIGLKNVWWMKEWSRDEQIYINLVKLLGCWLYIKHKHEQSRVFLRSSQSCKRVKKYNWVWYVQCRSYIRYRSSIEMGVINSIGKSKEES